MKKIFSSIFIIFALLLCITVPVCSETASTEISFTVYDNGITFSNQSKTVNYSSSSQNITFTGASNANGAVTYSIYSQPSGNYFTISGTTLTAKASTPVGSYAVVVKASAAGDSTHVAKDVTATITVTVSQITVTPTAPTFKGTLTYNGSAQALINAGSTTTGGTMYYYASTSSTTPTFSTSTWSTSVPSKTNAGTYYVWWYDYVSDTDKYTGTNINTVNSLGSKTINKADGSVTLSATSGTIIYPNTTSFTVSSNTSGGTLSVSSGTTSVATASLSGTTITVTPKAVTSDGGTSVITVTSAATTNYKAATATYTVTVNRGTITLTSTAYSGTYDGLAHSASIKSSQTDTTIEYGTTTNYGNTITVGTSNVTMSAVSLTNSGSQTVYYKSSKAGYKDVTGSTTITISKATNPLTYTSTQSVSKTFSTSSQTATLTAATDAQGTLSYAISSQKDSSDATVSYFTLSGTTLTIAANTPAGTYTVVVRATAAGNDNYESGTKDSTITVTIGKADNTLTFANQSWSTTYSSSAKTKTLSAASNNKGTLSYSITAGNDNSYFTLSGTTLTMKAGTPVGTYTLTVTASDTGNSNYNASTKGATITVTVNNATISVSGSNQTYTYDGSAHGNGVSVTTVNSQTATIKYGTTSGTYNLTSAPTATNVADSKTVYYQVSAPNHNTTTGSYTLTINKAAGSVTTPSAKSLTYNGSVQTLINAGSSTTGTIQYKLGTGSYDTKLPSATNAGTYTVYYKVIGDANHNDVSEKSLSVTINRASVGTKPGTAVSKSYTGLEQDNGYTTPNHVTMTGNSSGTNVGTYSATYTLDDNYMWSDGTTASIIRVLTINKVNPTLTSPKAKSLTYTGEAQKLVDAGTLTGVNNETGSTVGVVQYKLGSDGTYGTTIPSATDVGTYTVYYKVVGASNYNDISENSINVTIKNASLTVTAENQEYTYNGEAQGEAITATSIGNQTVTIKYGTTNGTYNLSDAPQYTNAGSNTVYYQASASNHNTVTGSYVILINKAENPITYTPDNEWIDNFASILRTVDLGAATNNQGDVTYTITSQKIKDGNAVSYFSMDGTSLSRLANTPVGEYEVVVRATAAGNDNYNSGYVEATITVQVNGTYTFILPTDTVEGENKYTYSINGYEVDVNVESQNNFYVVYKDDSIKYTISQTEWSDLTGEGEIKYTLTFNGEGRYAEDYTDTLTFTYTAEPITAD